MLALLVLAPAAELVDVPTMGLVLAVELEALGRQEDLASTVESLAHVLQAGRWWLPPLFVAAGVVFHQQRANLAYHGDQARQ